jgi:hypothetical protein
MEGLHKKAEDRCFKGGFKQCSVLIGPSLELHGQFFGEVHLYVHALESAGGGQTITVQRCVYFRVHRGVH